MNETLKGYSSILIIVVMAILFLIFWGCERKNSNRNVEYVSSYSAEFTEKPVQEPKFSRKVYENYPHTETFLTAGQGPNYWTITFPDGTKCYTVWGKGISCNFKNK